MRKTREITLPALQDFSACGQIILAVEAYGVSKNAADRGPRRLMGCGDAPDYLSEFESKRDLLHDLDQR